MKKFKVGVIGNGFVGESQAFAFKELDKLLPKRNMINQPLTRIATSPRGGQRKDI